MLAIFQCLSRQDSCISINPRQGFNEVRHNVLDGLPLRGSMHFQLGMRSASGRSKLTRFIFSDPAISPMVIARFRCWDGPAFKYTHLPYTLINPI